MAHLSFGSNINSALKMDGDSFSGPVPRWQRKAQEKGLTILPSSNENSYVNSPGLCITPHTKAPLSGCIFLDVPTASSILHKSPGRASRSISPGRTLKLSVRQPKTPTRNTPTTPLICGDNSYAGDRFIPMRPTEMELERSHQLLMKSMLANSSGEVVEEDLTPQEREHREKLAENLNDGQPLDQRIVHFSKHAPQNSNHANGHKILYSSASKSASSKNHSTRHIPSFPEKVMDAPELLDDYYLHLIDWSLNNHVVVALSGCVYIWNASDGNIVSLAQIHPPEYICSISWIKEGNVLAVGVSDGSVQLWDAGEQKLVRTMLGHDSRVATLAWNNFTLTSGARSGQMIHHDVRKADPIAAKISAHNQEICGLKWNGDGSVLASGGNDNTVKIWDARSTSPLHRMTAHQAAVKAVAWCPWQNNLLATGGGTADRTIRLWNTNTGHCIKDVLTDSQVSSIVWSGAYKELVTGHGFSQNQLTIWKYPNFTKLADLTGHKGRVLELLVSPDGQTVASAAADETIRLWKCWPTLGKEKSKIRTLQPVSSLARSIR